MATPLRIISPQAVLALTTLEFLNREFVRRYFGLQLCCEGVRVFYGQRVWLPPLEKLQMFLCLRELLLDDDDLLSAIHSSLSMAE